MSHLTSIQTSLQRLTYLEKALKKLNILFDRKQLLEKNTSDGVDLILPQSNKYNPEFVWDGNSYELVADLSFWAQPYTLDTFLEKVTQQYATESLVTESQKVGFQVIDFEKNLEGVTRLELEGWNFKIRY